MQPPAMSIVDELQQMLYLINAPLDWTGRPQETRTSDPSIVASTALIS